MEIVSSPEAAALIEEQGGRLFVWPRRGGCCGPVVLAAATRPPACRPFRRAGEQGFAVYVPEYLARLPSELHVELTRRRRVRAFWDGCAWIV
jgi:hypothetical protein